MDIIYNLIGCNKKYSSPFSKDLHRDIAIPQQHSRVCLHLAVFPYLHPTLTLYLSYWPKINVGLRLVLCNFSTRLSLTSVVKTTTFSDIILLENCFENW